MKNSSRRFLSFAIAATILVPSLQAGENAWVDLQPASPESEWKFRFTPYGWAAGVSGEFSQFGLPTVEVNQNFSDVLENLDVGAMGAFEARYGRYGLLVDAMHVRLSGSGLVPGLLPVSVPVSATSTSTTGMLAGQFRWLEGDAGYLDVFGGVRHWSLKTEIEVGAPVNQARSERVDWSDPVLGVKGTYRLSEKFYLTGWAITGGFVGNAEPIIDLMAGVGYQMNEQIALIFAYRHLAVDYHEEGFLYDAVQQGFGLGLDIQF